MNLFNVLDFDEYKKRYQYINFEIIPEFLEIIVNLDHFTLVQTFKEIEDKHFSHINPIFSNYDEIGFLTNDKQIQQKIFQTMDKNRIGRIDGFELISFIHFSIQGNLEDILENFMSDQAGKETENINRDLFFYYFDCFFRAIPKLTKLPQQEQQYMSKGRLNYKDLQELCENIFQDEEESIQKNEAIQFCQQNTKNTYVEFLVYFKQILNKEIECYQKQTKNSKLSNQIIEESMEELSSEYSSKKSDQLNQNDKKVYNNMEDLTCPNCKNNFDLNLRLPRLFGSCGHSFCTKCIQNLITGQEQIFCPIDNLICDFYKLDKGINSLPINIALQKLIKSKEEENLRNTITQTIQKKHKKMRVTDFKGVNYCIDHQKIADLVCLTDKKEICTDCVLFGQHRDHKYEKVVQFKNVITEKIEEASNLKIDINEYFTKEDMKEKLENKINSKCKEIKAEQQKINDKIDEELQTKQKELIEIIEEQFEKFQITTKFLGAQAREIKKSHEEINSKIEQIKNNLMDPEPDNELLLEYLFSEKNLFKTQVGLIQEIKSTEQKVNKLLEYEINKIQFQNKIDDFVNYFLNNVTVAGATIQKNNLDQILTPGQPFQGEDIRMLSPIQQPHHQKANFKKNKIKQPSSDDISLVDMKFDVKSNDSRTLENVLDEQIHKEKKYKRRTKKSKIQSFMHADLSRSFNRPKKKTQTKKRAYNMYHHSESSCSSENMDKFTDHETVLPQSHHNINQNQKVSRNLKFISLDEAPSKYKTKAKKNYIDLKNKKITDNQLRKYIGKLSRIGELEHLCLNNNKITDVGFKGLISKLAKLPNLQKIEIMKNSLTEKTFKILLAYYSTFKCLNHFVFLQDDFENLHMFQKEIDKLRSKGIVLDFNQFIFSINLQMFIIYFFLSFYNAQNFGYNQSLLTNRQFNTHYLNNSVTSIPTNTRQTQPVQIQQRQIITQPASSQTTMNFYPNQVYNQRVPTTPQQRQNLVILDQSVQPQNLLTRERLMQQLKQQVTNEMQRQSNQVEIRQMLQPTQVQQIEQNIPQVTQPNNIQQQILNENQQSQIQPQQQNTQQSIIDQIFQQNNQSIQQNEQQQNSVNIFPNQNSQQNTNQNNNQQIQQQQINQQNFQQQNFGQEENPFLPSQQIQPQIQNNQNVNLPQNNQNLQNQNSFQQNSNFDNQNSQQNFQFQQDNTQQQSAFTYEQNPLDTLYQQQAQQSNTQQQNQNTQTTQQNYQQQRPNLQNTQTPQQNNTQNYQSQQSSTNMQNYQSQQQQNNPQTQYQQQQQNFPQNQNRFSPQQQQTQNRPLTPTQPQIQQQNSQQPNQQRPQYQQQSSQQTNQQQPQIQQQRTQQQTPQQNQQEGLNLFQLLTFDELMQLRGIGQEKIQREQSGGFVEVSQIGQPKPIRPTNTESIEQQYSSAGQSLNYQYSQVQQQNQDQISVFQNGNYRAPNQETEENPFAEFNTGFRDERFNENNQNFTQNRRQQQNVVEEENPFL